MTSSTGLRPVGHGRSGIGGSGGCAAGGGHRSVLVRPSRPAYLLVGRPAPPPPMWWVTSTFWSDSRVRFGSGATQPGLTERSAVVVPEHEGLGGRELLVVERPSPGRARRDPRICWTKAPSSALLRRRPPWEPVPARERPAPLGPARRDRSGRGDRTGRGRRAGRGAAAHPPPVRDRPPPVGGAAADGRTARTCGAAGARCARGAARRVRAWRRRCRASRRRPRTPRSVARRPHPPDRPRRAIRHRPRW